MFSTPIQMVLVDLGGWINQRQLEVIDYLKQGNCVLREKLGKRRVRLNDEGQPSDRGWVVYPIFIQS